MFIWTYFSAIENIEGQWQLSGKPLTSFSVEQVVECDGMEDTKQWVATTKQRPHLTLVLRSLQLLMVYW